MKAFEGDHDMLSGKASQTRKANARKGGKETLPTDNDIIIFTKWIDQKLMISLNRLVKNYSETDYRTVLELTAVDLLLFNNKRPGETQRVELDDWYVAKKADVKSTEYQSMGLENQRQVQLYLRLDMARKKENGQGSIYANKRSQLAINQLLKYRETYGSIISPVHIINPSFYKVSDREGGKE